MPTQHLFSFEKGERIYRKKQIEQIFSGGKSRAFSAFPIKMVYCSTNRINKEAQVQVLISVSKRHFKHAVKRNRIKRQIREAYRLNKHILLSCLQKDKTEGFDLAFLWQDNKLYNSEEVHLKVANLLQRLAEKQRKNTIEAQE